MLADEAEMNRYNSIKIMLAWGMCCRSSFLILSHRACPLTFTI